MADVKFTAGPWEWSEDRIWGGYSGLVGANGQEVLFPNTANDGDDGAAWFEDFPSAADAHLIAASPDLYRTGSELAETISALLPLVDHEIEQRKCGGNDEDWAELDAIWKSTNAALKAHRAALSKANGGE